MLIVRLLAFLGLVVFLNAAKRQTQSGHQSPYEERIKEAYPDTRGREPLPQNRQNGTTPPNQAYDYSSPDDKRQKRYERIYWSVTGVASVAATLATITAAVFAVGAYNASLDSVAEARKQVIAASEANEINRRTLANAESSSVYFGNVFHISDTVQIDGIIKTTIRFKIGNSGASTTRALTYQTACTDSIEGQSDPYDRNVLATNHVYRLALAPKSEIEPIACTLEFSKVVQLAFQNPWIYIFGLAFYRDTTNPDMWHHVEFCLMTHGFGADTKGVTTLQSQCERHNCADDECSE